MQALPVSLMPEKLLDLLSKDEQRDLLTFLLQPPFEPAALERPEPPPARKRAEIEALLKTFAMPPASDLKLLYTVPCASTEDHGAGEHDYSAVAEALARLPPWPWASR